MRYRWVRSCGVLAILVGHLAAIRSVDANSYPQAASGVSGEVVDSVTGAAIPDAVVSIEGPLDAPRSTLPAKRFVRVNERGQFWFGSVAKGSYSLDATAAGYLELATLFPRPDSRLIQVSQTGSSFRARLVLRRLGAISGTVIDSANRPMAAVNVSAFSTNPTGRRMANSATASARSDERGRFRISGLGPGRYAVGVLSIAATNGSAAVQSRSPNGPTIAGGELAIRSTDGVVTFSGPIPAIGSASETRVFGTQFYQNALTIADAQPITIGPGEEVPGIAIQLHEQLPYRVCGQVSGARESFRLDLRRSGGAPIDSFISPIAATTQSKQAGDFCFLGIVPGQYRLEGLPSSAGARSSPGSASPELSWIGESISVGTGDLTGLNIGIHPGVTVEGRITYDSTGPTSADRIEVQLVPAWSAASSSLPSIRVRLDNARRFRTTVIPGPYNLSLSGVAPWMLARIAQNGRVVTSRMLLLTDDPSSLELTLTRTIASVVGHLREPSSLSVGVLLFTRDHRAWQSGTDLGLVQIGAVGLDGSFSFSGVLPGEYFVVAVPFASLPGDWAYPEFLSQISKASSPITIVAGQVTVPSLAVTQIRR